METLAAAEVLRASQQEPEVGSGTKETDGIGKKRQDAFFLLLMQLRFWGNGNVGHGWSRAGCQFQNVFDTVPISTLVPEGFGWDDQCFKTNLNNKKNFYFPTLQVI